METDARENLNGKISELETPVPVIENLNQSPYPWRKDSKSEVIPINNQTTK